MTASPSQFTLRTRMRRTDWGGGRGISELNSEKRGSLGTRCGIWIIPKAWRRLPMLSRFPTLVNPKPVGWVSSNRLLITAVHVRHDFRDRSGRSIPMKGRDEWGKLDTPLAQAHAVADRHDQRCIVSKGEDCGCSAGGTDTSKEWKGDPAVARMLVGQQPKK